MSVALAIPLILLLTAVNALSLAIFGMDKLSSMRHGWRVAESRLLLLALLGPFGAFAGMLIFRHKTRRVKFLLVPLFLVIQLYLLVHFGLIQLQG